MSKQDVTALKPFISVLIIIASLFSLVFFNMETRRMGYVVLKLSRDEKRQRDSGRSQMIQLAKFTRPERLHNVAQSRLTLKQASAGQIIQMTDSGIALRQ